MPIIGVVITIIVCGILLWLAETYIPMDASIKKVMRAVVIIVLVIWLLNVFGLLSYIGNLTLPRVY